MCHHLVEANNCTRCMLLIFLFLPFAEIVIILSHSEELPRVCVVTESDWLGEACFRLFARVTQSKNKSSGPTNTNRTCCISHVDGGVLKILPVCLSLWDNETL